MTELEKELLASSEPIDIMPRTERESGSADPILDLLGDTAMAALSATPIGRGALGIGATLGLNTSDIEGGVLKDFIKRGMPKFRSKEVLERMSKTRGPIEAGTGLGKDLKEMYNLYQPISNDRVIGETLDVSDTLARKLKEYTLDSGYASDMYLNNPELLEDLFKNNPNFSGTVYRGSRLKGEQKELFENLRPGELLGAKRPLPTSTLQENAEWFVQNPTDTMYAKAKGLEEPDRVPLWLTIKSKEGFDISPLSELDETEVMLKPGSIYRTLDRDNVGGIRQLLLEEMPEEIGDVLKDGGTFPINWDILKMIGTTGALEELMTTQNEGT